MGEEENPGKPKTKQEGFGEWTQTARLQTLVNRLGTQSCWTEVGAAKEKMGGKWDERWEHLVSIFFVS